MPKQIKIIRVPVDKGIIQAGDGEYYVQLPPGINGKVLTFDESEETGLKWSTPGAGSTVIKQAEVDFGTLPVKNKKFTITDAEVSSSSKIIANVSYDNPTGGSNDDAEWFEDLQVMARAGNGELFLYCNSMYADLDGLCKINYLIG
jgi:hypothetical protein